MIKIITLVVSDFAQNCRLLIDSENQELFIIDPGAEAERILQSIKLENTKSNISRASIILTHLHIDHVGAVAKLMRLIEEELDLKPKLLFHRDAESAREMIKFQAEMFGLSPLEYENVPPATIFIGEGDELSLGDLSVKILDTPGHAEGHISLYFDVKEFMEGQVNASPFLIAGDTLFLGSIGRTDLPGGNHPQLISSIKEKILTLPENTIVLSGHGSNTTVGHEKATNYFLN